MKLGCNPAPPGAAPAAVPPRIRLPLHRPATEPPPSSSAAGPAAAPPHHRLNFFGLLKTCAPAIVSVRLRMSVSRTSAYSSSWTWSREGEGRG